METIPESSLVGGASEGGTPADRTSRVLSVIDPTTSG
jgi:hypothetical protein